MIRIVRADASDAERYLVYLAVAIGGLSLFGGLGLLSTAVAISVNPLANPTGRMGAALLVVAGVYLPTGAVLARTRSAVAWSVLMIAFVIHGVAGTVLVSIGSIIPAVLGLYLGYRAATGTDYGIPYLSAAEP
jgi:hypothetical protein